MILSYDRKFAVPPLSLGNETILETANYNFMGIVLDKNQNFNEHLKLLKSK